MKQEQNRLARLMDIRVLRVSRIGLGFRIPQDWAEHNGISIGDTVYFLGNLDGSISVSPVGGEWRKAVKIRLKDRRYPIVSIPTQIARTRGIVQSDILMAHVVTETGELLLEKVRP